MMVCAHRSRRNRLFQENVAVGRHARPVQGCRLSTGRAGEHGHTRVFCCVSVTCVCASCPLQMFFRATLFSAFGASKRWLATNADGTTRRLTDSDYFKAGFITGAPATAGHMLPVGRENGRGSTLCALQVWLCAVHKQSTPACFRHRQLLINFACSAQDCMVGSCLPCRCSRSVHGRTHRLLQEPNTSADHPD